MQKQAVEALQLNIIRRRNLTNCSIHWASKCNNFNKHDTLIHNGFYTYHPNPFSHQFPYLQQFRWLLFFAIICGISVQVSAQNISTDTLINGDKNFNSATSKIQDSLRHRQIRKATLRSTFVPGWGQITNKQVWKVPAVAAAIGIPVYLFTVNLKEYKALKQAYIYRVDTIPSNDVLIPEKYQVLTTNSIKYYRDEYRKNVDLSAVAFIIAWGLNVVDATVYANLRDFDVGDKLSLRIQPHINPVGFSNVALIFSLQDKKQKALTTR